MLWEALISVFCLCIFIAGTDVHLAGIVTSVCYNACRGVFMNYRSRLPYHPAYQVENAVNEGGGSLCYAISGLLCWFQVSSALNQQ